MRKKVLISIKYYKPAYKAGGPAKSVSNLTRVLEAFDDLQVDIVARDRDSAETEPFPNLPISQWIETEGLRRRYEPTGNINFRFYYRLLKENYESIYLNSLFNPRFTLIPLLVLFFYPKVKIVLAPRGELSKGALKLKWLKKAVFLRVIKLLRIHRAVYWHATDQSEVEDIKRVFGKTRIVMLPNVVFPENVQKPAELGDSEILKIVFLSRISVKKNLHYGIEVLSKLSTDRKIEYHIYGSANTPGDIAYREMCEKNAEKLPDNIKVIFHGEVKPTEVAKILSEHHLFFLPTLGENFGHAIFEAISSRTPILLSDQTPWRNLEQSGIGWDKDLNHPEEFIAVFEEVAAYQKKDWDRITENMDKFLSEYFQQKLESYKGYRELFIKSEK